MKILNYWKNKMKIYKYKNYDEYVKCQQEANRRKSKNQWAVEQNIFTLANYIDKNLGNPDKKILGLCHGVRSGKEQEWFNKHLICAEVIGTEIGNAYALHTVKWDFNKVNPDWIGKFDFIYSNSFDHAFNPEKTLVIWSQQLKPGGIILLEYDKRNEHTGEISMAANKTDPVSITVKELCEKIPAWISNLEDIEILDMPVVKKVFQKTVVIKIKGSENES